MLLHFEGKTPAQLDEAKAILLTLWEAYPGHPWSVRVYDGGFFIKHLAFDGSYGMNCHTRNVSHDAAVMKRTIIRNAGEWLERAGMLRGRYDSDQDAGLVEGMPKAKTMDANLIMADGSPLRSDPRPQAVKSG